MTQPAPGYQPYQPMAPMMGAATPPQQRKPSRGGVTTMLAGVLALVVAGLAVGGSFGAVTTFRNSYELDGDTSVYATRTTWWGFSDDGSSTPVDGGSVLAGLTLVLVAALLVVGAVFAFVAARTRASGPVTGTRSLLSAGVGVLLGASLLQLLMVLKQMEQYNEQELDAGEAVEFSAGLGLWLPLGGLVLGLVAVVLAHVGQHPRSARMEPNTPRMGFPAPYGYRPQQMPVQQKAQRPQDVQPEGDDSDTQVVSGATAAGTAPTGESTAQPPAPVTPATTTPPAAGSDASADSPAATPVSTPAAGETEPPVTPPVTPATTSAEAPADAEGEQPAPLPELPAAPPAPELSSSDESKNEK